MDSLQALFNETEEDINLSLNPFTQYIIEKLYDDKEIEEKSIAALESYVDEDILNVQAEPAQLLNFDFSTCPEGVYFLIELPEARLDGYYTSFCMKRIEDKLCFELSVYSDGVRATSFFNPVMMLQKMMEVNQGTALACDTKIYDTDGDSWINFFYVHHGGGNMYKPYMDAFAVLEKAYHKALDEMKKEASKWV